MAQAHAETQTQNRHTTLPLSHTPGLSKSGAAAPRAVGAAARVGVVPPDLVEARERRREPRERAREVARGPPDVAARRAVLGDERQHDDVGRRRRGRGSGAGLLLLLLLLFSLLLELKLLLLMVLLLLPLARPAAAAARALARRRRPRGRAQALGDGGARPQERLDRARERRYEPQRLGRAGLELLRRSPLLLWCGLGRRAGGGLCV